MRKINVLTWLVAIIIVMSIASGCSSAPAKVVRAVHIVEIRNMEFVPAALALQKGDTVRWINKDLVTHDVTRLVRADWRSPAMPPGTSWSTVPDESADYYCSIHQVMKAKLVVQ